jgi:hypothetical protein
MLPKIKKNHKPTEAVQVLVVTSDSMNIQKEADVSVWKQTECLSKKLSAAMTLNDLASRLE